MQVDAMRMLRKLAALYDIQITLVREPFEELSSFDCGLRRALDPKFDWDKFGQGILESLGDRELQLVEDAFGMHYAIFPWPEGEKSAVILGPWHREESRDERVRIVEQEIGSEGAAVLQEYYSNIRIGGVDLENNIVAAVSLLFEEDQMKVVRKKEYEPLQFFAEREAFDEPEFQREIAFVMLEERYHTENLLLDAISLGDEKRAFEVMQKMGRYNYNGRFKRSAQGQRYSLSVSNALFRKAIERSDVHPYYIDELSTRCSVKIQACLPEEETEIFRYMVREYCNCVKLHSLKNYSPMVQKVINYINLNLDSALSLKNLADMCFISSSYLSGLFKQEVGTTLTDYINTQRIKRAARRLRNTDVSIAAASEQVGILDVNYFTKMFKKVMGVTPTQYRKDAKNRGGAEH